MPLFRCPPAPFVVCACTALTLIACGDSAPEAGSVEGVSSATSTGQGLTSGSTQSTGSSSTLGGANTTGGSVTATVTTAAAGNASTTGAGASGGGFSDTTTGGNATSTTGVGPSGAGGSTGSGGANATSSVVTGGGGAGGSSSSSSSVGGTGGGSSECAFAGNITYQFNQPDGWPADVVEALTSAMDEALYYYNCYADLSKELTINYDPGVPTAQGNVDGWISFGSNKSYMVVATAMHEVAHTLGVGYSPWTELMDDGTWTGPAVVEFMMNLPAEQRDPDMYSQRSYITGDSQHFWPYGLNQASEHQSEWSLINHVRIVAAMQLDKQAYLAGEL